MLEKLSDHERREVIFRPINQIEGVYCIDVASEARWPLYVKVTGEHPMKTINEVLTVMPPYLEAHLKDYNGATREIEKTLILIRRDDESHYRSMYESEPIVIDT